MLNSFSHYDLIQARHVAHVKDREFECPKCGLKYNELSNQHSPCLKERHGMRSHEFPEPANEVGRVKPPIESLETPYLTKKRLT